MSAITQIKVNGIVYDLTDARVPAWALEPDMKVKHNLEAAWNAQPLLQSKAGVIYVYDDHYILDSQNVPAIKIGDGNAYLIDLPFITDYLQSVIVNHTSNTNIHVTTSEKNYWNSKLNSPAQSGEEGDVLSLDENGNPIWSDAGRAEWGYIEGTLSNQADLSAALSSKVTVSLDLQTENLIFT